MSRSRLSVLALEDRTTPVTLADGFNLSVVTGGLTKPSSLVEAPDGRLFVTEQDGALRVVATNGTLAPTPVLQLDVDSAGERGLLGVALDPAFATNGHIYLYHTVPGDAGTPAHNRVTRFTLFRGNIIDPATARVIYDFDALSTATNHNGGALHFGTDGKLYVAAGENANAANAQSLTTDLGKILRLNPDGTVPADNPTTFAGLSGTTAGKYRSIYAVGFRNPFTFGVNAQTGQTFVNDVGANAVEEVDVLAAGANYGWPTTEGDFDPAAFPNFTRPVVSYPHTSGTAGGFTVIGGAFYTPAASTFPTSYAGDYFYADFVNQWVKSYDVATGTSTLLASDLNMSVDDLDVSLDGSLILLNRGLTGGDGEGQVVKIQSTTLPPPPPLAVVGSALSPQVRVIDGSAPSLRDPIDLSKLPLTPALTGGVRVAEGNRAVYNPVVVVGSGPAQPTQVAVLDIAGGLLASASPFEAGFTGGVFVAMGDLDGNGKDEIVVSPDEGGGPRVRVYRDGDLTNVMADFFGIDDPAFRGGARVAVGDVTGDGVADLVVTAGFQGGPRVAGFEGKSVAAGRPVKMFNDFFAFEPTLRNGVYVTVLDANSDGKGDIVVAGGPGGGPRVQIFSGAALTASNALTPLANFFAGNTDFRNGVRVGVMKNYLGRPESLLVGPANGEPAKVSVYYPVTLSKGGTPTPDATLVPFGDDFAGGVFVG